MADTESFSDVGALSNVGDVATAQQLFDCAFDATRQAVAPDEARSMWLKAGRRALEKGDLEYAEFLVTQWLAAKSEDFLGQLARFAVLAKREGGMRARLEFNDYLQSHPINLVQESLSSTRIRCATLVTAGIDLPTLGFGSLKLREGHMEAQHLLRHPDVELSIVFADALHDGRELQDFDLVFNAISDPDRYRPILTKLASLLSTLSVPVINPPQHLLKNVRNQFHGLQPSVPGVIFPKTLRLQITEKRVLDLASLMRSHGISFPVLFRPGGTQTGKGLVKIDSDQTARILLEPGIYYLIAFHDFQSTDGYYRKYRFWRVGDQVIPNHVLIGDNWNVHGTSRFSTMKGNLTLLAEDERLVKYGLPECNERILSMFKVISACTGLDCFGVDFGIDRSGNLVVFEANPTMRSYYPEIAVDFPHATYALQQHVAAFQRLVAAKIGGHGKHNE